MPLPVRVYTGTHDTTLTLRDSLQSQDFRLMFPVRPDSVALDPDGWVLHQTGDPVSPPFPPGTTLSFSLAQNYPNPFNAGSIIGYVVPGTVSGSASPSGVTLTVFDVLGRKVETLVDAPRGPGEYFVRFNGLGRASGVYFYRLEVRSPGGGSTTAVRKMIFIK
jgi:hypothetical protein